MKSALFLLTSIAGAAQAGTAIAAPPAPRPLCGGIDLKAGTHLSSFWLRACASNRSEKSAQPQPFSNCLILPRSLSNSTGGCKRP